MLYRKRKSPQLHQRRTFRIILHEAYFGVASQGSAPVGRAEMIIFAAVVALVPVRACARVIGRTRAEVKDPNKAVFMTGGTVTRRRTWVGWE